MDIRDLLLKNVMIMDLKGTSKEAVIDEWSLNTMQKVL